jgi:hypothetical protein
MAIETAHGDSEDLGNGVTRSYVKLADLSALSALLAAVDGSKLRIVGGLLFLSAAGQAEVKSGTKKCFYGRFAAAPAWTISDGDILPSKSGEALSIEASAATTCDGFVDWITTQ